ncbi:L-type lectin-domain containing receptor kinase IX.1-like [Mangifera indica]|uniref:L-type lectin-domain containing receptor kinase IX.1-like n=1 Tax=Mangifera indica TaxID=29780 RepID=UPI001CFB8DF6|nr:L-type lectin-domain containing receptor kinase IX.1-like [Mangifera indica]
MASPEFSKSSGVLSSKMSLLLHLNIITVLLSLTVPFVASLSFKYDNFSYNNDDGIVHERACSVRYDRVIQLVQSKIEVGRASYSKSLPLWDKTTGRLTDFSTHFSFVIDSEYPYYYGDGMAFFLAPENSTVPTDKGGGSFGLTNDTEPLNSTSNPFVAVEFDIFHNDWDPPGEHVGIDISSMRSMTNVTWWSRSNIEGGLKNEAWISYNSSTQNLSVAFTGFRNNVTVMQHLDYKIDLREFLPESVKFGFSAATGEAFARFWVYTWEFNSTLVERERGGRKITTELTVGLSIGGAALVGGLVLLWLVSMRRKRYNQDDEDKQMFSDDDFEKETGPKRFPYKGLAEATNNFNDQNKLGEGGFGGVYKGFLRESNSYIAVKRVSKGSKQGVREYASEVKIISRLRHKNLVQLLGWCHERKELLLVYEFMPNGSLDSHLFKENSLLTWEMRYKIAQDLASGLLYLHEEWEQCVVHRDIKSSNVMLDSNFNAKIGDFGLARLVEHSKGSQTTLLAGTIGYMAPECVITGKASKESDVYSFGVVALELACGRKPIKPMAKEGEVYMVKWVWEFYGSGKLLEAADPRLSEDFDEQQMQMLMIVGLWCAQPDENLRPSIRQAIRVLNSEAPLPVLPPNMPVPTYLAPSGNIPISAFSISYGAIISEGGQNLNQSSAFNSNYHSNSSQSTAFSGASSSAALLNNTH